MIKQLEENNFVYIPNFLDSEEVKRVTLEFKEYIETNEILENLDSQVPKSQAEYNFISFLELLTEKTPEVSKLIGERVLPTYAYSRIYKKDAVLHRHHDREACEVSVTVHLGGDNNWPIYIQKPNGEVASLELKPGDAMIYLGCDADHWREPYQGTEYVQVFLHYVRSRGDKAWAFFDITQTEGQGPLARVSMKEKSALHREKLKKDYFLKNNSSNDSSEPCSEVAKPNFTIVTGNDINLPSYVTKKSDKDLSKGSSLYDYILVVENVMSPEVCDAILDEYAYSTQWQQAEIESGPATDIRSCNVIPISHQGSMRFGNYDKRKFIDSAIFESVGMTMNAYFDIHQVTPHESLRDSGYDLLRYKTGEHYSQHVDSSAKHPRHLSCSIILNEDYEGGEFAFFDRSIKFRPPKGSAIMFPSNFMYPHEITQVTKGTRYSIVTWII